MAGVDDIYTIRTPLVEEDGLSYGGILRTKIGRQSTYLGFGTEEIAYAVAEHWGIGEGLRVELCKQALEHEPASGRAERILVFAKHAEFLDYLKNREDFPFDDHLMSLGSTIIGER